MAASWNVDFKEFDRLENKLKQIPNESEKIVNNYLHNKGMLHTMDTIRPLIPISTWKGRVVRKRHARDNESLRNTTFNLGFTIRPKKAYDYLKYPDLGIGTSQRNLPIEFMANGLEKSTPKLVDELNNNLTNAINKTLGG